MPLSTRSVTCDTAHLADLAQACAKASVRAQKLGVTTPVTFREVGPRKVQYLLDQGADGVHWCERKARGGEAECGQREVTVCEVTFERLVIPGGWQLLGVVERGAMDDSGKKPLNLLRASPSAPEGALRDRRHVAMTCDHCRARRKQAAVPDAPAAELDERDERPVARSCEAMKPGDVRRVLVVSDDAARPVARSLVMSAINFRDTLNESGPMPVHEGFGVMYVIPASADWVDLGKRLRAIPGVKLVSIGGAVSPSTVPA